VVVGSNLDSTPPFKFPTWELDPPDISSESIGTSSFVGVKLLSRLIKEFGSGEI
jgi:hypothetical protein